MRIWGYILMAATLGLFASAASATDEGADLRKPPTGTIAAQLRLKNMLRTQAEGSLLAAINHNRQDWDSLSPDQRDQYRRSVLAFLDKSPQEQEKLLKSYDQVVKLSAAKQEQYRRRAIWIKAVVDRMSPEEKSALLEMTPENRAKALVEKRDELLRQGVQLDSASSPATATATAPVG